MIEEIDGVFSRLWALFSIPLGTFCMWSPFLRRNDRHSRKRKSSANTSHHVITLSLVGFWNVFGCHANDCNFAILQFDWREGCNRGTQRSSCPQSCCYCRGVTPLPDFALHPMRVACCHSLHCEISLDAHCVRDLSLCSVQLMWDRWKMNKDAMPPWLRFSGLDMR